jgi:transposase
VLRDDENLAAESDDLPPLGNRSDREAAHYYRSMHARAVEREERWKQRALAAEKFIKQLLVLVLYCVEKIAALTRQVAWFNKQTFGSKSESTPSPGRTPSGPQGAQSDSASGSEGSEQAATQGKRKRGQQPGAKGPKRQRRVNLPPEIVHHTIPESERTCPICHRIDRDTGLTEESERIEWEVQVKRYVDVRHIYHRGCHCAQRPTMVTAPKPAKLIAKGLFGISFWLEVILKKFDLAQPLQRTIRELDGLGLPVSPGTLDGGLQKIQPMLQPLVGQFVLRARVGFYWHMDETRYPMFLLIPGEGQERGKPRRKWWIWVVVGLDATAFLLEPTRSGQVPKNFFPKGTEGILNVDRFKAYFGLLGPDWKIKLAFCWSHQRRDFINLGEGSRRFKAWSQEWVGLINQLFSANRKRRKAWFKDRSDLGPLDQEVRRQVEEIKKRLDRELAGGQLAPEQEKILQSMRRHWKGLTVFVDHPQVPMDNNAAERALRQVAVARKNFYGSASKWSGDLACGCFTILATLRQHGICPRRYFRAYLEACARAGGKAPENLEEFLPWKWSAEKKVAWSTQEQAP